jgi:putative DNA primase/helicase
VPTENAIWWGIAISTAENSIDDLAVLSHQQREYGELARAHDVPAVKAHCSTVFDRFPKGLPSNKRRAWVRKQLRLIRMAAESNHGQALDPVILEIIRLGSEAGQYVRECMKEFRLALGTLPRDGALRHAVENFACIYAGGCVAIKAGVVKWTRAKVNIPRQSRGLYDWRRSKRRSGSLTRPRVQVAIEVAG